MKSLVAKFSVYLNLILGASVLSLANQLGWFDPLIATLGAESSVPDVIGPLNPFTPTDTLVSQSWWQDEVTFQATVSQNQQYDVCLFGDSISSGLGNTLGDRRFNFALGGMSTVSLIAQLNTLQTNRVQCQMAVIAMGTNDADYGMSDDQFRQTLKAAISLTRQMGATQIILLPAFYSTVAASHNINLAAPLAKVEKINILIREIAHSEKVMITATGLASLYQGQALKQTLTTDGVHLNAEGRRLYRQALLTIFRNAATTRSKPTARDALNSKRSPG